MSEVKRIKLQTQHVVALLLVISIIGAALMAPEHHKHYGEQPAVLVRINEDE